jgi:two-component sensor histidine kinase
MQHQRATQKARLRSWTITVASMAVFVLALMGVMAAAAIQSRQRALAEAARITTDIARLLESQVTYVLDVASTVLTLEEDVAQRSDLDNRDETARMSRGMRDVLSDKPYLFRIFLTDKEGTIVASSLENAPPLNAANRSYFQRHRAGEVGPILTSGLQSQASGEPLLIMSKRIDGPTGEMKGIAIVSFDLRALRPYFQAVAPSEFGAVFQLIDNGMMILVDVSPPPDDQGQYLPAEEASYLQTERSVSYRGTSDRVFRIWTHLKIAHRPLFVRVGTSIDSISDRWRQDVASYAVGSVIALLAMVVLIIFVVRFGIREQRAVDAVRRLNADLEFRVQERTAELERLTDEMKQSLKDKDILFKEVHHRVKNNLQVVSSMVRFSSFKVRDEGAQQVFAEIARRIRAIGLVHQTIYEQHATTRVALGPYVQQLAELEGDVYGARDRGIEIFVESTGELDLNNAISAGLIISELVSNSLKHAFRVREGGRIDVKVHQGDHFCCLRVTDNGVGLPDDTPSNTGLSIVRAIAAQLNADLTITSDHGTDIRVSFPVL